MSGKKEFGTTNSALPGSVATGDQSAESVADVLKKARALIEKPENWTSGEPRARGAPYCLITAVQAATNWHPVYDGAAAALRAVIGGPRLVNFNSTHTHSEVLAAFDRAIELATSSAPGTPAVQS